MLERKNYFRRMQEYVCVLCCTATFCGVIVSSQKQTENEESRAAAINAKYINRD